MVVCNILLQHESSVADSDELVLRVMGVRQTETRRPGDLFQDLVLNFDHDIQIIASALAPGNDRVNAFRTLVCWYRLGVSLSQKKIGCNGEERQRDDL